MTAHSGVTSAPSRRDSSTYPRVWYAGNRGRTVQSLEPGRSGSFFIRCFSILYMSVLRLRSR